MPTFCRHNRFVERCPICSKALAEESVKRPRASGAGGAKRSTAGRPARAVGSGPRRTSRGESLRVRREVRASDDGYRSSLVPGLHATADAHRLAEEIAFSCARLRGLEEDPPGPYGEIRALAGTDLERATWACFQLAAELSAGQEPGREAEIEESYRGWVARGGGSQAEAFRGEPSWTPERRFERLFERLALPGFSRNARYELLVTLGRLGLYELRGGSLAIAGARGASSEDPTTVAMKRIFAIGDPLILERRAAALAGEIDVPIEALDLALSNWASPERETRGFPAESTDEDALGRARYTLGL